MSPNLTMVLLQDHVLKNWRCLCASDSPQSLTCGGSFVNQSKLATKLCWSPRICMGWIMPWRSSIRAIAVDHPVIFQFRSSPAQFWTPLRAAALVPRSTELCTNAKLRACIRALRGSPHLEEACEDYQKVREPKYEFAHHILGLLDPAKSRG